MFRFPWSNFHELNLDWILEVVKEAKEIFINGEGDIQHAVETSEQALDVAEQAAAAVIADGAITIPKLNNEVLKTTAYVVVGNRANEAVPAGAYVYLRNSLVSGLSDGIYIAASAIPAGAIVTPAEFQQPTELHDAGALNVLKNTLNQLDAEKADEASLAYRRSGATNTGAQIATGTYFYLDGTLKRAIATIAQNASFTAQNCETVTAGGLNDLQKVEYITVSSTYGVTAAKCGNIVSVFVKYDNSTGFPDSGSDIMLPVGWRPSVNIRQKNYTGNFAVQVAAAGAILVAGTQDNWINVFFTYIA